MINIRIRRLSVLLLLIMATCAGCQASDHVSHDDTEHGGSLTVFLVRHAERLNGSSDSPLSETGMRRVRSLVSLLRDAEIDRVYSTDYRRTRGTAEPVASTHNVEILTYDLNDLEGFAASVRAHSGRVLVVGHSNTTPQVVEHLGGEPGTPIDDATEYDRLYIVTVDRSGTVDTVLLRY